MTSQANQLLNVAEGQPTDLGSPDRVFGLPTAGMTITSEITRSTYVIGEKVGEGAFGIVYGCTDIGGTLWSRRC
jgi:hypothetical protein